MAIPIRIVFADDHRVFCEGLVSLAQAEGLEVAGICGDRHELIELVEATSPDVAVVDVFMPGPSIPEIVATLQRLKLSTRLLVLTASDDPNRAQELMSAGVSGYVLKEQAFDQILTAIRAVAAGQAFVSPHVAGRWLGRSSAANGTVLTSRQLQVLRLVAAGDTNQRIARKLGLHVKTVDNHRYRIREKLGVHSAAEMVCVAMQRGLI